LIEVPAHLHIALPMHFCSRSLRPGPPCQCCRRPRRPRRLTLPIARLVAGSS
jgi:hypothetical protein